RQERRPFRQMQRDRPALEQRQPAVLDHRDLPKGLHGAVLVAFPLRRNRGDRIGTAGLLQHPAHAEFADEAARELGQPIIGVKNDAHRAAAESKIGSKPPHIIRMPSNGISGYSFPSMLASIALAAASHVALSGHATQLNTGTSPSSALAAR